MENIKVKVNNEAESKEVQKLFFELGYKWVDSGAVYYKINPSFNYITAYCEGKILVQGCGLDAKKELTIPQLKDMVVLKRNSIDDATHKSGNHKYYLTGSEFYEYFNNKWVNVDEFVDGISFEPIEKKEMTIDDLKESMKGNNGEIIAVKEFLVNRDGKWTLQLLDSDTEENSYRVAVPSGMNIYWKEDVEHWFTTQVMGYRGAEIIWQRSEAASLNDQYAEIEKVRQDTVKVTIDELKHRANDKVNNPSHYSDSTIECIDAMEAMLSPQEFIGYLRGNMFKYQWRYQKKNGIEDLQKSAWYLKKLIEKEIANEENCMSLDW